MGIRGIRERDRACADKNERWTDSFVERRDKHIMVFDKGKSMDTC